MHEFGGGSTRSTPVRSFDGSTTSSAVNGSRCDRIRRGEGASKRDSKGQKRDEERRRERESEAGDRRDGGNGREGGGREEEREDEGREKRRWEWESDPDKLEGR